MAMATPAAARSQRPFELELTDFPVPSPLRLRHSTADFRFLAEVELQLIMRFCDLKSLLALARCSRFTLDVASKPHGLACRSFPYLKLNLESVPGVNPRRRRFGVWQRLRAWIRPPPPPPPQALERAQQLAASLLRFCDIHVRWTLSRGSSPVTFADLDAFAAIPRLTAPDSYGHETAGPTHIESLARRHNLRNLIALVCDGSQQDDAATRALAECSPLLSTVRITTTAWTEMPLHLLPALTDLTVQARHSDGLTMASVARCAGLRRLTVRPCPHGNCTPRDVHTALLSPTLRTLEHLDVYGLDAFHADGRQRPLPRLDWVAAFSSLAALRSLQLEEPRGIDELLTAISAGCAQFHLLQISSNVDFAEPGSITVALSSAAVLRALLVRRPALRSVALILPSRPRGMPLLSWDAPLSPFSK